MATLKAFVKAQIERKRYTLRYDCWLDEGEVLADFAIGINPLTLERPLVAEGAYVDLTNTRLTTYIGGGVAGTLYTVRFIATTSQGQVKSDDIQMRVT